MRQRSGVAYQCRPKTKTLTLRYSTSFLTRALPSHGQIDTLELSPLHAQIAQQNFIDADLYPFPRIHIGPALDLLRDPNGAFAKLPGTEEGLRESERGYDLAFIDADKEKILEYFLEAIRLVRKGGVIVVDNAIRGGR
jgi:predicted O-methyltransferase YrrM